VKGFCQRLPDLQAAGNLLQARRQRDRTPRHPQAGNLRWPTAARARANRSPSIAVAAVPGNLHPNACSNVSTAYATAPLSSTIRISSTMKTPWPGRRGRERSIPAQPLWKHSTRSRVNRDFSKARELHCDHTELIAIPMTADDNGVRLMMGTPPSADKPPYHLTVLPSACPAITPSFRWRVVLRCRLVRTANLDFILSRVGRRCKRGSCW